MELTRFHFDYETKSEIDLLKAGVDLYSAHESTEILMASFKINDEGTQQWVPAEGERMPSDMKEALRDPSVAKIGFNAQFERLITQRVLSRNYDIEVRYEEWYCSMVLAYMYSFMGGLDDIAKQMGLKHTKDPRGKKLINMFCGPNKVTKNQPFKWRDQHSDPVEWEQFKGYNIGDTDVEHEVWSTVSGYSMPDWQWAMYHIDQIINDRGLPINRKFVENALLIADRRKSELIQRQNEMTGLANSNSGTQLLPWLQDRGYDHRDLQKDTLVKALAEEEQIVEDHGGNDFRRPEWTTIKVIKDVRGKKKETTERIVSGYVKITVPEAPTLDSLGYVVGDAYLTQDARTVMRWRQSSSKTSTTKYSACMDGIADDDRLRHCFQYAGASRTNRWAGRKIQPQNLPRTPKWLEPEDYINFDRLDYCNQLISDGDYDTLGVFAGEQMDAVAGCVRSAIQAPLGKKLVICDLSSIESVVIGWVAQCERLLNVFRDGKDAYKDFATELYNIPYDAVTKTQRSNAKPATLGAGYRLSGGEMREGKKTGLWSYAEGMGIKLTKEESHKAVRIFREAYHEIPSAWYAIENCIERAMRMGGKPVKWNGLVFEVKKPFLRIILPSGRPLYYYKLRIEKVPAISRAGNEYEKTIISYMGKDQVTTRWQRIESHGGKFIENIVQAIARDILCYGMQEAHEFGFNLVGHVHDELICEQDVNDSRYNLENLRLCMTDKIVKKYAWLETMPLGAAGFEGLVYRKD